MGRDRLMVLGLGLYQDASRSCHRGCVVTVKDGEELVAPCDYHQAWLNGMVALIVKASGDQ